LAVPAGGVTQTNQPPAIPERFYFTLNKAEKPAIIGPSGSGKSTCMRCVNYLEVPTAGHIFLGDELIGETRLADGALTPHAPLPTPATCYGAPDAGWANFMVCRWP